MENSGKTAPAADNATNNIPGAFIEERSHSDPLVRSALATAAQSAFAPLRAPSRPGAHRLATTQNAIGYCSGSLQQIAPIGCVLPPNDSRKPGSWRRRA